MKKINQIPISEGLLSVSGDNAGILASRCVSCGSCYFPPTFACHNPECSERNVEEITIRGRGKLWSYTCLEYTPPYPYVSSDSSGPIMIGIAEFPQGLRILGQLTGTEGKNIQLDGDIELVLEKLYDDDEGNEVVTWKFLVL